MIKMFPFLVFAWNVVAAQANVFSIKELENKTHASIKWDLMDHCALAAGSDIVGAMNSECACANRIFSLSSSCSSHFVNGTFMDSDNSNPMSGIDNFKRNGIFPGLDWEITRFICSWNMIGKIENVSAFSSRNEQQFLRDHNHRARSIFSFSPNRYWRCAYEFHKTRRERRRKLKTSFFFWEERRSPWSRRRANHSWIRRNAKYFIKRRQEKSKYNGHAAG
jgi:hypothetical protein